VGAQKLPTRRFRQSTGRVFLRGFCLFLLHPIVRDQLRSIQVRLRIGALSLLGGYARRDDGLSQLPLLFLDA